MQATFSGGVLDQPWTRLENLANIFRMILAVLWTLLWGTARWIRYSLPGRGMRRRRDAFSWGRRNSPKAVWCEDCGWSGPLRWAVHTYVRAGYGPDCDVEPVDNCPRCGREDDLQPVIRRKGKAWRS